MPRSIIYGVLLLLAAAILTRLFQSSDALSAIGDFGTSIAKPVFVPLVLIIAEPSFVYVASLIIVMSAFTVVGVHLGGSVRRELSSLHAALRGIVRLAPPAPEQWPAATAEISALVARHGVLTSAWTTYLEEANQLGRLPSRRFSLFAESDPWNPINRRGSVVESLPSYYTTIGLILTFIGLVVALYFASRGFRSGDMVEARSAIVQLLNASAFKFLTSVSALLGAFVISVAHRSGQWALRRAVHDLASAVDLRLQSAKSAYATFTGEVRHENDYHLAAELKATRAALEALTASLIASRIDSAK